MFKCNVSFVIAADHTGRAKLVGCAHDYFRFDAEVVKVLGLGRIFAIDTIGPSKLLK